MSKRILILGGARFHGLLLAKHFCNLGDEVYVLNRGRYKSSYDFNVKHLKADRNNKQQLKEALADHCFDVVIDNNAYTSSQILLTLELIQGRCKHYIFTSSVAVYLSLSSKHPLQEKEATGIKNGFYYPDVQNYALNKFFAELTIINNCYGIKYTCIRLPLVFGEGDFIKKLLYFYLRFKDGGKVLLEKELREFSFIYVRDVVNVYGRVVLNKNCYNKIFNIADPYAYCYEEFFSKIYGNLYSKDKLFLVPAKKLWDLGHVPFVFGPKVDTSLSENILGKIKFTPIEDWGKLALKWEVEHFKSKISDAGFKKIREDELMLIKRLTNDR